jgi:hypothetical protein
MVTITATLDASLRIDATSRKSRRPRSGARQGRLFHSPAAWRGRLPRPEFLAFRLSRGVGPSVGPQPYLNRKWLI